MVIVRLINGKNGKPIAEENLNVWINDSRGSELFRPDRDGIIKLAVKREDVLSFASNIQVTCHPYDKEEHEQRKYRVSSILEHGIADKNMCSTTVRVHVNPGEFIFYERPRTLWEWFKL